MKTESERFSSLNLYYTNIRELPLDSWIRCTDGDLTKCRKGDKGNHKRDLIAWEMVYDDYLQINGLGKMYEKLLKTMIEKAKAELDFCITGDRFKLTKAEMEERKIETMLKNKGSGMTINQTLIHLSKWIGHWLNVKELKSQEYFDLLNEYEKFNKPQRNG